LVATSPTHREIFEYNIQQKVKSDVVSEKSFGERLSDGWRLLSDDFGEQDNDKFVTFEDDLHDYLDEEKDSTKEEL